MNEDYLNHWTSNYMVVSSIPMAVLSDTPNIYLIATLEDKIFLSFNSKVSEVISTNLKTTLEPSFFGTIFKNLNATIIAESDVPFTKQTHPELFI